MSAKEPISFHVVSSDLSKVSADALVIAVSKGADGPVILDAPISPAALTSLKASLSALGVTGAADQVVRLPGLPETGGKILVLAGIGKLKDGTANDEALRRTAGAALRQLSGLKHVVFALPTTSVAQLGAIAEGAALGAYQYASLHSSTEGKLAPVSKVTIHSTLAKDPALAAALERAAIVAKAVNATRTLVNEPPSKLYPATFAEAAKDLAKGLPVKVTVLDEKRLLKEGWGGIMGVGQGSSRPPRMVKLEYKSERSVANLAFVGKGITFDSGGISIKPGAGMVTMKCDMAGAGAVLNAVLAVAALGLPVNVTGWLCIAENMPSGTAIRPSDVLTMFGGKTVEVLNTDAEGRLVMADGLVAASQEFPDVIIDVATLTGAQMMALGNRTGGVMGDEGVSAALKAAADRSGELIWPMPLPEELRPSLDSPVADMANIGERMGGMMTAAVFLQEFIGKGKDGETIPWAHLDIAGPAFNEGAPYGYTPKQGTGMSVRTLVAYVEDVVARSA
ncbi:leucyl aminopeptidase [Arthrobacter sp. PAMC 25486]|uniref:leucyl aminopeptidase n=1 Tax=Arthrobacter sp. PAMC 25486 TaxID=1494608 RepID=UPI000535F6AE|nr:leucyl aminopeptidase [Arthrobacter sp. PAMC 25486]AIX99814.1 leucyl aminopeptidase [Arthrobacter sp. PAMC 25486]